MQFVEWMMDGTTHLNIGAAPSVRSWVVWSDASGIGRERPFEPKFVSILPASHTPVNACPMEEQQP
ncbi:hypothetical protein D9M69_702640 [compost metagenome]